MTYITDSYATQNGIRILPKMGAGVDYILRFGVPNDIQIF